MMETSMYEFCSRRDIWPHLVILLVGSFGPITWALFMPEEPWANEPNGGMVPQSAEESDAPAGVVTSVEPAQCP